MNVIFIEKTKIKKVEDNRLFITYISDHYNQLYYKYRQFCKDYGCKQLLEPARAVVGPIIINSGFRNKAVNRRVGGVRNSQHLLGQAADIRPRIQNSFSVWWNS